MALFKIGSLSVIETIKVTDLTKEAKQIVLDEANPDFLYFRAKFVHADTPNGNGDLFSWEELLKSAHTFIGKPLDFNHNTQHVIGRVLDAYPVEKIAAKDKERYIEGLCRVDRQLDPKVARQIETGDIKAVSFEVMVETAICSICGKKMHTTSDYCDHVQPGKLLQEFEAQTDIEKYGIKRGSKIKAYAINEGATFTGLGAVYNPADSRATILNLLASLKEQNSPEYETIFKIAKQLNIIEESQEDVVMPNTSEKINKGVEEALKKLSAIDYINVTEFVENKKAEAGTMIKLEASAYSDFMKKFMQENPGKSIGDAAKAWVAQKEKPAIKEEKMEKLESPVEKKEEKVEQKEEQLEKKEEGVEKVEEKVEKKEEKIINQIEKNIDKAKEKVEELKEVTKVEGAGEAKEEKLEKEEKVIEGEEKKIEKIEEKPEIKIEEMLKMAKLQVPMVPENVTLETLNEAFLKIQKTFNVDSVLDGDKRVYIVNTVPTNEAAIINILNEYKIPFIKVEEEAVIKIADKQESSLEIEAQDSLAGRFFTEVVKKLAEQKEPKLTEVEIKEKALKSSVGEMFITAIKRVATRLKANEEEAVQKIVETTIKNVLPKLAADPIAGEEIAEYDPAKEAEYVAKAKEKGMGYQKVVGADGKTKIHYVPLKSATQESIYEVAFLSSPIFEKSKWVVFKNELPIIQASLNNIWGDELETVKDFATNTEYGISLIERIKEEGEEKVASLLSTTVIKYSNMQIDVPKEVKIPGDGTFSRANTKVVKEMEKVEKEAEKTAEEIKTDYVAGVAGKGEVKIEGKELPEGIQLEASKVGVLSKIASLTPEEKETWLKIYVNTFNNMLKENNDAQILKVAAEIAALPVTKKEDIRPTVRVKSLQNALGKISSDLGEKAIVEMKDLAGNSVWKTFDKTDLEAVAEGGTEKMAEKPVEKVAEEKKEEVKIEATIEKKAEEVKIVEPKKEEVKTEVIEKKAEVAEKKEEIKKEASAFDKLETITIGDGYTAIKVKGEKPEDVLIVIKDKEGKEVKKLPDGFGDDVVSIIKLVRSILNLPEEEKKEEMALEIPKVEESKVPEAVKSEAILPEAEIAPSITPAPLAEAPAPEMLKSAEIKVEKIAEKIEESKKEEVKAIAPSFGKNVLAEVQKAHENAYSEAMAEYEDPDTNSFWGYYDTIFHKELKKGLGSETYDKLMNTPSSIHPDTDSAFNDLIKEWQQITKFSKVSLKKKEKVEKSAREIELEAQLKEEQQKKYQADFEKKLSEKVARANKVIETMKAAELLDIKEEDVAGFQKEGSDILDARVAAIEKAADEQLKELLSMNEETFTKFASSVEKLVKRASLKDSGKLKTIVNQKVRSIYEGEDDWIQQLPWK